MAEMSASVYAYCVFSISLASTLAIPAIFTDAKATGANDSGMNETTQFLHAINLSGISSHLPPKSHEIFRPVTGQRVMIEPFAWVLSCSQ